MFIPVINITIGPDPADKQGKVYIFNYVHELTIDQSWKEQTSRAEIWLPKKINMRTQNLTKIIKLGMPIKIEMGYAGYPVQTEFTGYITDLLPKMPFGFKCEDEMWDLKQNTLNFDMGIAPMKLSAFIKRFCTGKSGKDYSKTAVIPHDFDIPFIPYVYNASSAQLLKGLEEYGVKCFFQDGVLHAGFAYPDNPAVVNYNYGDANKANMIDIALEYRSASAYKVKIKAISYLPGGQSLTYETGSPGGSTVTVDYYNLDETALKKVAEDLLPRIQMDGWKGSFETFGLPYAKHGNIANITSDEMPELIGQYYIDKTRTTFGVSKGFKRHLYLGASAGQAAQGLQL